MAGGKKVYLCSSCGREEPRWLGKCPECGEWNSFTEVTPTAKEGKGSSSSKKKSTPKRTLRLKDIPMESTQRFSSGLGEFDRVLGGGLMMGGTTLIGGEPGIGKSTLMLQILQALGAKNEILYISGEESLGQIKHRAQRVGVDAKGIHLICETEVESIIRLLERINPLVVVVDSIQTLVSSEVGSVPGTVNQLKYCTMELIDWAKRNNRTLFLVGHITKDGSLAGPKVVEHMVDTVLYFEQTSTGMRVVRAAKNRYGSVDEIGLFTMESHGLQEVLDPRSIFLEDRKHAIPPGIAIAAIYEGSRTLVVEIQALTVPAKGGLSRIYSDKIEAARVSRVTAVLEKQLKLSFSDQDVYINVAGGMKLKEVGLDIPLALALYSARVGIPVPGKVVSAGELTLAGEVRHTPHMAKRCKTVEELGFSQCLGPHTKDSCGAIYQPIATVVEGLALLFKKR